MSLQKGVNNIELSETILRGRCYMVSILQMRKMRFQELRRLEVTGREEAGIRIQTCLTPKALCIELDHIPPKSNIYLNRKWVD